MEQHKLTAGPLLDEKGNLAEAGYATSLVKTYDRGAVTAGKSRIKEWDYFYLGDEAYGVAVTVADNAYMTLASVSFLDFGGAAFRTSSEIKLLTRKRLDLPAASFGGNIVYATPRVDIALTDEGGRWRLKARFDRFDKAGGSFSCDYVLEKEGDSMVIAIPFDKPGYFYYNQKINCLKAEGSFTVGGVTRPHRAVGVLDWGRGVWTYKNTWYWASLSYIEDGVPIGLNLGYGFGDTSRATENMLFVNGKAHKLGNVAFDIPMTGKRYAYTEPWTIRDDEGRLNLDFYPVLDRADRTNALLIESDQHQVFGRFRGYALTDDGRRIEITNKIGFAERVHNRW